MYYTIVHGRIRGGERAREKRKEGYGETLLSTRRSCSSSAIPSKDHTITCARAHTHTAKRSSDDERSGAHAPAVKEQRCKKGPQTKSRPKKSRTPIGTVPRSRPHHATVKRHVTVNQTLLERASERERSIKHHKLVLQTCLHPQRRSFQLQRPAPSPLRQGAGLRRRHSTASWTYLFRMMKVLSSSSSSTIPRSLMVF